MAADGHLGMTALSHVTLMSAGLSCLSELLASVSAVHKQRLQILLLSYFQECDCVRYVQYCGPKNTKS